MTRNEFIETVKDEILSFVPERLADHDVRIQEVRKTGDKMLSGLSLIKGNGGIAPVVYLDNYYEMYNEGYPMDDILSSIAKDYDRAMGMADAMKTPDLSYENIKDRLRVRLLYNRSNSNLLNELVSRDLGCDYSAAVFIDLSDQCADGALINVRYDMADAMVYDIDQLFEDAVKGSVEYCPAKLSYIVDVLIGGLSGNITDLFSQNEPYEKEAGVLVLYTEDNFAGSAALFYPGIQERIAQFVGGSYYVIPSSIHEMLIYPDTGDMSAEELAYMVKTVNQNEVMPSEQLGNRVLYYDADAKDLSVAHDLDRECSREEAR